MRPLQFRSGRRVAVLAATSVSAGVGGAERLYEGLTAALKAAGCAAELLPILVDESSYDKILEAYERCRSLDLSSYDLVISTKAPTYCVRHPNHIVLMMHTVRIFYDMFEWRFPQADKVALAQREQIVRLDTEALRGARRLFAQSHEVAARMRKWNGLDAEVLYPALGMNRFHVGSAEGFLFLPGRLHPWKRVDLAIDAVKGSRHPLRLVIAGTGEAERDLRSLAAGDRRIEFRGRISDGELIDLYSRCSAVPFVPIHEDYGYVTLEAFASGKPVITCTDSGEPVQLVAHEETGWVCEPSAESVRAAMEDCLLQPAKAMRMGRAGLEVGREFTWERVTRRLLEAGFVEVRSAGSRPTVNQVRVKVAVLDMQPITPAVGGGRLRLLGLYHALGGDFQTRYVGSYDWQGERPRQQQLTPTLEELVVPLSDDHHAAARRLSEAAGGKVAIDIAFPRLGHLSADFLRAAREAVDWADVVVFSHPWVYPLVAERVRLSQLVVYDSHNVEGFLRAQLLDLASPTERQLQREVLSAEYRLGSRADLVLACSCEDRERFWRIYDWPFAKMRIVPNGVMAASIGVATPDERSEAKRALGLDAARRAVIFIGSAYGPNIEAATFTAEELAPLVAEMDFVIAGGVGSVVQRPNADNVHVTGQIDDQRRLQWLRAADFGVNPMSSGSGTNIKMFDLMAAGLPTVTTAVGARGIDPGGRQPFVVVEANAPSFAASLRRLCADPAIAAARAREARECVEDGYAWERISPTLGNLLRSRRRKESPPYFSIVVPTYERHAQLDELMTRLEAQMERDFEAIVVDQSAARWPNERRPWRFALTYIHTDVRGAVRARNTGADCSRGRVIAFTDDDCLPEAGWLLNARSYFESAENVGVEGLIESDHLGDPAYRPVTNVGFEGVGFMTANLLVRSEAFHRLNGFDLDFDRPHFREDTDFGWRLQALGAIPYAPDVRVFHPAQPRRIERESEAARARFFEKDALLLAKHPNRYRELFEREGHWYRTPGFWENFERGAEKYSVDISAYRQYLAGGEQEAIGAGSRWPAPATGSDLRVPNGAQVDSNPRLALLSHFCALLDGCRPIEAGAQASPVDMLFAYRLLLARMPAAPAELTNLLGWRGTWREFLQQLLASPEFGRQLGFLPPGLRLMSEENGFRFWFATDDREMGALMAAAVYEPAVVELLKRLIKPGFRCLDVGAQTGFYTCHMARAVGAGGAVYSFEPMPKSFALLQRNVVENGWLDRVQLHQVACSDVQGEIRVGVASGMFVAAADGAESIPSVRLDDLELGSIDVCKIDVEGFEPRVIAGMASLLKESEPILVTEVNEYWLRCAGTESSGYCRLLDGLGYRLFDIDQKLCEVDIAAKRAALSNFNILAIPSGRVDEVLAEIRNA